MFNYVKETITKTGTFDAGHRVMYERFKCNNLHGHTYKYELTISYTNKLPLGYAIDFKEIKRTFMAVIEHFFDHGMILNPADTHIINMCEQIGSKYWVMYDRNTNFRNPTVENICQEVFYTCLKVSDKLGYDIRMSRLDIWETPTSKATLLIEDPMHIKTFINEYERDFVSEENIKKLDSFSVTREEYDSRNLKK